ncbi:DUF262 domain-containing HNH endonuclease family protein [Natroniella acetigena]|uniref:DUF262 domain-containing protein n=1 Tax=Natroniella acetigena TaxID=52004 RepID=UPI00200B8776|nr:DUF262 domain-containing protein [Natroniella acetigena]MCK8827813.1 DUF262 domain-containing HNH endonuclease family protein [Natroniella acetigena]
MGINPSNKTIDDIFANKEYKIDFYQRDYKWKKKHVESLLNDIFYKFNNNYDPEVDASLDIIDKFDWYYLHTYVVNTYNAKTYIVDGQQRFTTLNLILIKLYHLANNFEKEEKVDLIKNKIYGPMIEGKAFWMGDNGRDEVLDDLLSNGEQTIDSIGDDISLKNIYQNYEYIKKYLEKELNTAHKFDVFLFYFLKKINLVEISIEDAKDVPMVFEVINDRGESLKPYEVFKGELLGQLKREEVEDYYDIWTENISKLQIIDEKEVDRFFRFYFRAKYVESKAEYKEFDGEYHRTVFSSKWDKKLKLRRNPIQVKHFIKEDFDYYAKLYLELLAKSEKKEGKHLYFNYLNGQERQYLLIMSAIKKDDSDRDEKIELVSKLFDRHYSLLKLMGCYDSNQFTESIIDLNSKIRDKDIDDIKGIFNQQLLKEINETKGINIDKPLQWNLFREAGKSLGPTFIRYFFSRVDHLIAEECHLQTDSYYNLVKNRGHVNGYHVEHILADNDENREVFSNEEDLFYSERNRLGALLILKGRDNKSSSNETYKDKLKTYSHATLWAQTLTEDFYHCNPDFNDFIEKYDLNFRPIEVYDQKAVIERQKLLFEIAKIIWE